MTGQYIVGPTNLLQNLTDDNMGDVLTSLDGTLMLLENLPAKFEHLAAHVPLVTMMTHSEVLQYWEDNKADWVIPMEI
jgi:hypothetical protein